jgi:site-specific DNA-methyltransferase (adenine-specific)
MHTTHKVFFGNSKNMDKIKDRSIQLIITSPPYWNIKDYGGNLEQIGFAQSYQNFLTDLNKVWDECYRILEYDCYIIVVVGDVYLRAKNFDRFRTITLPDHIVAYLEKIGFDFITRIIWHKISTTNASGGCSIMGSIYYPRNPRPTMEHEFILVFKKYTPEDKKKLIVKKPTKEIKELSRVDDEEWFSFLRGIWNIRGKRQKDHPAQFPIELVERLIKMYSFVGENVCDCFLGSGSTTLACILNDRNSYCYEINRKYKPIINKKIKRHIEIFTKDFDLEFIL